MEEKFELETNTIWSFPNRGKWATHDAKYRGNFSPYVAKNIILRYSKPNDLVLDQFVGGGTTLIECKLKWLFFAMFRKKSNLRIISHKYFLNSYC